MSDLVGRLFRIRDRLELEPTPPECSEPMSDTITEAAREIESLRLQIRVLEEHKAIITAHNACMTDLFMKMVKG